MNSDPNCTEENTPLAQSAPSTSFESAPLKQVESLLFPNHPSDLVEIIYREGLHDAAHSSPGVDSTSRLLTYLIHPQSECEVVTVTEPEANSNPEPEAELLDQVRRELRDRIASFLLNPPTEKDFVNQLKDTISMNNSVLEKEYEEFKNSYVVFHLQELYHILSTNFIIKIFNLFCQSLLKAEYIFDAEQSKLLKKITEQLNNKTINDHTCKLFEWAKTEKNPQNDKWIVLLLCESCLILNHRIKANLNPNDPQHFVHTRETHLYTNRYEYFNRYYLTRDLPESLPDIIWIFPYLFQLLTDMTAIDHCFAVGIKEMSTLLNTQDTITKAKEACDKFMAFCTGDELQDDLKGLYDVEQIKRLQHTLDLLEGKTKFLIYKVLSSDTSKTLSSYDLMVDKQVNSLHEKVEEQYKDQCKHCTLYAMFDNFVESIVKHGPCPQSEREYENNLFSAIQCDGEHMEHMYRMLAHAYYKQNKYHTDDLDKQMYQDVILYNRKIIDRVENQFIHYGYPLKKLLREVGNVDIAQPESRQTIERHLDQVGKLLQDRKKQILSCSFLTQHLAWCLRIIGMIVKTRKHAKLGFEMVGLVNTISLELDKLVHAVETNCDAANYGSLFEDCFYRYDKSRQTTERLYLGKTENIASIPHLRDYVYEQDNVIFIASTFLRPIGKTKLRDTYIRLNHERKNLVNKFYLTFVDSIKSQIDDEFNLRLEKSQADIDSKLDGNRRSVIQILGIFSAFIALAASSLAASKLFETASGYTRFVLSMTLCLCMFVALLQFVISDHRRSPRQMLFRYGSVFTLILLLSILLLVL